MSTFVVNPNFLNRGPTVMDTPDTFEVVKINDTQVHVRHILEKHFYSYGLAEDSNGEIKLSDQPIYVIEGADQETRAETLYGDARTFAEERVLASAEAARAHALHQAK